MGARDGGDRVDLDEAQPLDHALEVGAPARPGRRTRQAMPIEEDRARRGVVDAGERGHPSAIAERRAGVASRQRHEPGNPGTVKLGGTFVGPAGRTIEERARQGFTFNTR